MYIPLGFNASSQCTGSGFCFTYANFGTIVDDFSYRNLCNPNIIVSASLQPGEVIQFISANQSTVNGIGANTHLVDARWSVIGGCDNLIYRSYTIDNTGGGTRSRVPRFSQQNIGDTMPYGSGGKIVTGGELPPGLATFTSSFNPDNMIFRSGTEYTLVDNGPVSSSVLRGTGKNSFNRVMYVAMTGQNSGSQANYLNAAYRPVSFNIPAGVHQIDIVSPTLPQLRETASAATHPDLDGYRQREFTTVSRFVSSGSCYSFTFDWNNPTPGLITGPDRTFSWVDCNNVTQSLVVSSSIILGICMKADSLRLPTITNPQSFTLSGAEVCTGSIPL